MVRAATRRAPPNRKPQMNPDQTAIRAEFARQASAFEDSRYAFGRPDVLAWMTGNTPAHQDDVVLEVAAGTGWCARALSPLVRAVVATDITPEMLSAGNHAAELAGLRNIVFQEADAEHLPFLDDSFDRVLCRLSLHHLKEPSHCLSEMVRVCRAGGTITVIDMVTTEGAGGVMFNKLEWLRDRTHQRALTRTEMHEALAVAGTRLVHTARFDNRIVANLWLSQTQTPPDVAAEILARLEDAISGGPSTGSNPRHGEDGIEFTHRWELAVGSVDA
jgi:ubiquinone/menaquinone biosynthesis C-methylase UbiE